MPPYCRRLCRTLAAKIWSRQVESGDGGAGGGFETHKPAPSCLGGTARIPPLPSVRAGARGGLSTTEVDDDATSAPLCTDLDPVRHAARAPRRGRAAAGTAGPGP